MVSLILQYAYFVHSYFVKAEADYVSGVTDYGLKFPAIIERENIFGIQFHPEKSQSFGLKILENFLSHVSEAMHEVP